MRLSNVAQTRVCVYTGHMHTEVKVDEKMSVSNTLDWFTNNATHIVDDGPGREIFWSRHADKSAIRVVWDTERRTTVVEGLAQGPIDAEKISHTVALLNCARVAATFHTILAQRERNHPLKHGFTQHTLPSENCNATKAFRLPANFRLKDETIPSWENTEDVAWFAPDSDPNAFGTLFIYPTHNYLSDQPSVVWNVGQVGLGLDVISSAEWHDDEGVAAIFQQVLDNNSDYYLTLAAISDTTGRIKNAKDLHAKYQQVMNIRSAFSRQKDRIKPLLVADAVGNAFARMSESWKDELRKERFYTEELDILSLNSWSVFGYLNRPSPLNIAYTINFVPAGKSKFRYRWFPDPPQSIPVLPPEHFDDFVRNLAAELAPRSLGTILRAVDECTVNFYIVKNVELFVEHRNGCDVPAGAAIEQYDTESDAWHSTEAL